MSDEPMTHDVDAEIGNIHHLPIGVFRLSQDVEARLNHEDAEGKTVRVLTRDQCEQVAQAIASLPGYRMPEDAMGDDDDFDFDDFEDIRPVHYLEDVRGTVLDRMVIYVLSGNADEIHPERITWWDRRDYTEERPIRRD